MLAINNQCVTQLNRKPQMLTSSIFGLDWIVWFISIWNDVGHGSIREKRQIIVFRKWKHENKTRGPFNEYFLFFSDLVHCTNEPNISVPQLANLLIERSQNTNWVVVYKALVTVHHMMCYGNEVSVMFF